MVKPIVYGAIGGGVAVAIAIIVLVVFQSPTQQYALSVESSTEEVMGTGNMVRIYVHNTGSSPLTNVKISYGASSEPALPILNPGEKQMFSPPAGTKMVTVTDDQNVTAMKSISDSMQ